MRAAITSGRRVAVAGGEIEFDVTEGARDSAAAVILLHGWALDRRMWAPQLSALSPDRLVIALDRRGFGFSSAPPDLARETDDVVAVLDSVGKERAVVVGMSQAGMVATEFALRHPRRVAGLVFQGVRLGSVAAVAEPDIPVTDYAALARAGRLGDMKALWRGHPLMRLADGAALAIVDRMLDDYSGADLMRGRTLAKAPDDAAFATIRAPALFLTGELEPPLRRRVADHLSSVVPGAERAEIARAGHLCNLCAPDAYNAALLRFLDPIDAGATTRIF